MVCEVGYIPVVANVWCVVCCTNQLQQMCVCVCVCVCEVRYIPVVAFSKSVARNDKGVGQGKQGVVAGAAVHTVCSLDKKCKHNN